MLAFLYSMCTGIGKKGQTKGHRFTTLIINTNAVLHQDVFNYHLNILMQRHWGFQAIMSNASIHFIQSEQAEGQHMQPVAAAVWGPVKMALVKKDVTTKSCFLPHPISAWSLPSSKQLSNSTAPTPTAHCSPHTHESREKHPKTWQKISNCKCWEFFWHSLGHVTAYV